MEIRTGHIYEVDSGLRVEVIRRTGSGRWTVRADETAFGQAEGDRFQVREESLRPRQHRPYELEQLYQEEQQYVRYQLDELIKRGEKARADTSERIQNEKNFEPLAREFNWGHGVEEDIKAYLAKTLLELIDVHGMERALSYVIDHHTQQLTYNLLSGGSSNGFHNAVESVRREMTSRFLRDCQFWLRRVSEARAKLEVL